MMTIAITDGTLKARVGKYMIYDIDYLLDNLSREVYLLESYRKQPPLMKFDKDEFFKKVEEMENNEST